ncbi:MAG: 3-deoxy-manno-octulosonate cytidylyltransferase, partial [Phycisphaerales bacterium]|nr:3-deoxy-manno-octulosonate cytidylyltransferase [Phycisphaerales bacterium]
MGGAIAIIPARLASTRFPEKVLASRTGRPLIRHVFERASMAGSIARVVVATDHERIAAAVRAFGGECVMTSAEHPNGTSRLDEAARLLGLADDAIVVNVQGDEPEIDPRIIDAAVEALEQSGAEVATVGSPFSPQENRADPAIVKVVCDARGMALYFSRAPIPFLGRAEGGAAAPTLKHVGLYAYRV